MDKGIKAYVGLDVHKDTIALGVAEAGRAPARVIGTLSHDVNKLLKTLDKLGGPEQVHVVYEAGPTGFGLQRALAARGYTCEVIAPSLVPKRASDRIKTDRRDCLRLAECSRAGDLRAVWVPDPEDEAMRDLARAREDAVNSRTQARHQLKAFLRKCPRIPVLAGPDVGGHARRRWDRTVPIAVSRGPCKVCRAPWRACPVRQQLARFQLCGSNSCSRSMRCRPMRPSTSFR